MFGDIYGFSDTEENMDGLETKYKFLAQGIKDFTKQKKKLGADKKSQGQIDL